MSEERDWLTMQEFADQLGISKSKVRQMVQRKKDRLPHFRDGGCIRISKATAFAWINRHILGEAMEPIETLPKRRREAREAAREFGLL